MTITDREEGTCFYLTLMFVQHFQPTKEYLSILNKKWSEFAGIIVTLAAGHQPYQVLKNCRIGKVSTTSSMEPTRVLFLDTTRLAVPQTSDALSTTATARSSHRRCSVRKGVLRNFIEFTGKHLCKSFFFNKVVDLSK